MGAVTNTLGRADQSLISSQVTADSSDYSPYSNLEKSSFSVVTGTRLRKASAYSIRYPRHSAWNQLINPLSTPYLSVPLGVMSPLRAAGKALVIRYKDNGIGSNGL
jgi:hypothetical protein